MGTKAFGENGAGFLSMKSIIGYKRQGIPGGWWRCIPLDIPSACRIALPECAWKKTSWNRMWGLRVPVSFHPFCIPLWQNGVSDWIWHCRSALAGNYKNAGYILFLILDKIRKRLLFGRHKKCAWRIGLPFMTEWLPAHFFLFIPVYFFFFLASFAHSLAPCSFSFAVKAFAFSMLAFSSSGEAYACL